MTKDVIAGWDIKPLEEVASFQNGHAFYKDGYSDSGLIAIDLLNVSEEGKLKLSSRDKHVSQELSNRFSRFILKKGDIIIVMTDMTQSLGILGKCAVINQSDTYILNQRMGRIVPDEEKILRNYLYYFINSEFFLKPLHSLAKGAVQKYVNTDDIKKNKVFLPPKRVQERIANILSDYDDLIENNTRRIAILEEMAQSLYREWFVHFRFSGHEKNTMVESPLGMIPEGWEVVRLGDVCFITMGQSPRSQFYNSDGNGLPFHQGVTNFGNRYPTDRMYCTAEGRLAQAGDILFSVRAPVGRINIADKKIIIGRGLSAIKSKTDNQAFIFQQLKEQFQKEDSIGNGAIFKAVTKEDVHGIKLVYPMQEVISIFEAHVKPIFSMLEVITNKNAILRRTRDLLLPKLISGELDVEELDIEVGGDAEDVASVREETEAVARQDRFSWGPGDIVFSS